MKVRVLDTCILIDIWKGKNPGRIRVDSDETARTAAKSWLGKNPLDGIVTPVRLEFLGGTNGREDLRRADLFLGEFELVDEGKVLVEDWRAAERIARRVREPGRSRGAVDSLISAICERVHAELHTRDTGM